MKKALSIVLAVVLLFSSVPFGRIDNQLLHNNQLASIGSASNIKFKGSGKVSNPYLISSLDELMQLSDLINAGDTTYNTETTYYLLQNDIILDQASICDWSPIGSVSYPFLGVFDGNGYRISFSIKSAISEPIFGVFGFNSGTIKHLGVYGQIGTTNNVWDDTVGYLSANYAGGIVGFNNSDGNIENCSFYGNLNNTIANKAYAEKCLGGICGCNKGKISECCSYQSGYEDNEASLIALRHYSSYSKSISCAGGIAGKNGKTGIIENCFNTIQVLCDDLGISNYYSAIGGIVGNNEGVINGSYSNANIKSSDYFCTSYAGGIAGKNTGNISFSFVGNNITVSKQEWGKIYVGRISGADDKNDNESGGTVTNCVASNTTTLSYKNSSKTTVNLFNTTLDDVELCKINSINSYFNDLENKQTFWSFNIWEDNFAKNSKPLLKNTPIYFYDKNDNEVISFGIYPQSLVSSNEIEDIETKIDNNGWVEKLDISYQDIWLDSTTKIRVVKQNDKYYCYKWEPLTWTVIDKTKGLVICNCVVDRYYFNKIKNTSSVDGTNQTIYANDYSVSDVREWLNNSFINTALSDLEKTYITEMASINGSSGTQLTSATATFFPTEIKNCKVFLPTYEECQNTSCENTDYSSTDKYYTRSSGKDATQVCSCEKGVIKTDCSVDSVIGIRPVLYLKDTHPQLDNSIIFNYLDEKTGICYYNDDYFGNSSNEYNSSLATMAMCLSMASQNNPSDQVIVLNNTDLSGDLLTGLYGTSADAPLSNTRAGNIYKLYKDIGFSDVLVNGYYLVSPAEDSIGVIIGHKELSDNSELICVTIRSGQYYSEWSGNCNIGEEGNHKGFVIARNAVIACLSQYIDNNMPTNKEYKLLITGYSRGAATTNMVSGLLDENYYKKLIINDEIDDNLINNVEKITSKIDKNNLFAYCFEPPAGYYNDVQGGDNKTFAGNETSNNVFDNIFCIVNPNDAVPYLAPAIWGFGLYGTVKYIPTIKNDGYDYQEMLVQSKCLSDEKIKKYVLEDPTIQDELLGFVNKIAEAGRDEIWNNFLLSMKSQVGQMMKDGFSFEPIPELLSALPSAVLKVVLSNLSTILAGFETHEMQYCFSWLASMDKNYTSCYKNVLIDDGNYLEVVCNGASTTSLLDNKTGDIKSLVTNGKKQDIFQGNYCYVDDNGQTHMFLDNNNDYTLLFDNGTVQQSNILIKECTISGDVVATHFISGDNVESGEETMISFSSSSEPEYELINASGEVLATAIKSDDVTYYFVSAVSQNENLGTVEGTTICCENSVACLYAKPNPGAKFLGWYDKNASSNVLVSNQANYSFIVTEDVNLEARFSQTLTIKQQQSSMSKFLKKPNYIGHELYYYIDVTELNGNEHIVWQINNDCVHINPSEDGVSCVVFCDKSGTVTLTVSIIDDNGISKNSLGEELSKSVTIDVDGGQSHSMIHNSHSATCYGKGYTRVRCKNCTTDLGFIDKFSYTPKLEHSFTNGYCTMCKSQEIDLLESEHNYEADSYETWTIDKKGADSITLTFSDETELADDNDTLELFDRNNELIGCYHNKELTGKEIVINGDFVEIVLATDCLETAYGFKLDKVNVSYSKLNVLENTMIDHLEKVVITTEKMVTDSSAILNFDEPFYVRDNGETYKTGSLLRIKYDGYDFDDYVYILYGDINSDGASDVLDLVMAERAANNKAELNKAQAYAANGDINEDVTIETYQNLVNAVVAA